jgi:hypothetical protein
MLLNTCFALRKCPLTIGKFDSKSKTLYASPLFRGMGVESRNSAREAKNAEAS